MIGTTLDGKYHIRKLLGEGAMGSVYEAEHTATGRRVAVKVISSADLTKDPKVVSRFQREARAAGAIETQHITQVLDAGVDRESNLPFLVMEYMVGEDLMALVKRVGPLSPDLVLRIAAQACLGLQKAHEANVVHRDIKPHNLFLARREAGEVIVKLLDFGIAKVKMDQAHDTEGAELTRTGNLLGSPLYMSPEQARGHKEIDKRTDIWSMGAVMYQALTGRTPYHHINALGELIISICSVPPPSLQDFAPWVPPEVTAIVHRCLQQDPARRFQGADEMLAVIRQLLPYGWAISEDMLMSLQDSMRQQAAPRLQSSIAPPPMQATATAGLAASPSVAQIAYGATVQAGSQPGASTTGALTQSQPTMAPPPAPASKLPLLISGVALAAVVAGGIVLFGRNGTSATPPQPPAQAQVPPPSAAPPPEPAPSAAPAATPAPTAEAPVRRVFVVISPLDATVELDGERVTPKNGVLEFSAPLGSLHSLRLFKGATPGKTFDISVTESGAFPPKVDLLTGPVKPAGSSTPAAGTAPTPTAPKGISTNTDEFGN